MDVPALATAFVLTHNGPPRGLEWRPGGFGKNSAAAIKYCERLEEFIRQQSPTIRTKRLVVWRNRVLRQIYMDLGIERKKS
jgi:hypothetical protein